MSWSDLAVAYLLIGELVVGLTVIFLVATFLPGLMRTTGEIIGAEQESPIRESRSSRPEEYEGLAWSKLREYAMIAMPKR
jgi:hypothetical protein